MNAPPIIAAKSSRFPWGLLGGLAVVLAIGFTLFRFDPTQYHYYPRCLLYTTTGIYCPGCGCLRAVHQLSHGHVLVALHYNPLFILSLPIIAWLATHYVPRCITGEPVPPLGISPIWGKVAIAFVILFSILRNIPVAPFNWLAPP
jgi:hypothetical protein